MRRCGFGLSRPKRNFIVSSCSVNHRRFYFILFVFWVPSLALRLPVLVPASQGNFHLSEVTHQPVTITSNWWKLLVSVSICKFFSFFLYFTRETRGSATRGSVLKIRYYLMFYYELKLYWMKVCWLYERS
jgi:hypothetical protein